MARKIKPWLLLAPILLLSAACTGAKEPVATPATRATGNAKPAATTTNHPAPIEALEARGLEVLGTFDAPSGLTGYAGLAGTDPVAVYLTSDGQHALVGSLLDAQGNDVGAEAIRKLVVKPVSERTWSKLQDAAWVQDGKTTAPRTVYAFSDPNCPYCNLFWEAARPWVDAGKVQLRHVMVGVIRADSANKAAAILTASSPEQALTSNERNFANGGIKPVATVSAKVRADLNANELLMLELGFQGTPGILFLDEDGNVQRRSGMPQPADLTTVLGPR
jgi:thiol:disulfide interchange protein DsbG